jgi:DNA-binding LacI/PurR family transcriptional regulator
MNEKVTLKDIAKDSGLSISTVSRALARSGKISKENERKVFESAQRLNYPIAVLNTPIDLRNTINIALVTRHYTGEFFASLFEGFDISAKDTKARINLISVSHSSETPAQVAAEIKKSHFDAAIIFLPDYKAADYKEMIMHIPDHYPVVSIAPIANPVMDTVTFDNYRGGHLIASHFQERGYKKLGIIEGPRIKSEAMLRKNGFLDYIRASDDLSLVWEFDGDYSLEHGQGAYNSYKESVVKPEAIFCSNDGMAIGFMQKAIRDGVSIPDDVAVAGFDDLPTCELYTPTITSVHTPYDLLGKKTLELIFDRLLQKKTPVHTGYTSLVPVSLSVRESSTKLTNVFQNYFNKVT